MSTDKIAADRSQAYAFIFMAESFLSPTRFQKIPRDFIECGGDITLLTQPGLGGCRPDRQILVRVLDEIGAGDAVGDRSAAVRVEYQAVVGAPKQGPRQGLSGRGNPGTAERTHCCGQGMELGVNFLSGRRPCHGSTNVMNALTRIIIVKNPIIMLRNAFPGLAHPPFGLGFPHPGQNVTALEICLWHAGQRTWAIIASSL